MSWEDKVRKVTGYVPGEQPKEKGIIKLNTNECPYPPAPEVEEVCRNFQTDSLRLYPDPDVSVLREELARVYGIDKEEVFVGVGSDDVLSLAFMTYFSMDKKHPILFPDITYSFYDVWAELYGIPYETVPLHEDFTWSPDDYIRDNGGVILANPNAPTGIMTSASEIEKVISGNRNSVVIIDEAYIDFGGESVLPLIHKYENLLVVQTFSKSRAMAGARIGYAMGCKKIIGYLQEVKFSFNSYTMNIPTIEMGVAALKNPEYFKQICNRIIATRERVGRNLIELGFDFKESKANFLFVKHQNRSAKELFELLKKEKIYVRYFNKPRIDNYLRITVGTDKEMDVLLSVLQKIIKDGNV